jgi:hypothetical protein
LLSAVVSSTRRLIAGQVAPGLTHVRRPLSEIGPSLGLRRFQGASQAQKILAGDQTDQLAGGRIEDWNAPDIGCEHQAAMKPTVSSG